MNAGMMRTGSIKRNGDAFVVRLEQYIEHGQTSVWYMLTEPGPLAQWLAPGTVDLRPGGRISLDFSESGATIDSVIRDLDPPRVLEYSWSSGNEPERPLRWELEPLNGSSTRLTLTLRLPAEEDIARAAAGWDTHLEMLLAALESVPIRFPVDHFREARNRYRDHVARQGAGQP